MTALEVEPYEPYEVHESDCAVWTTTGEPCSCNWVATAEVCS